MWLSFVDHWDFTKDWQEWKTLKNIFQKLSSFLLQFLHIWLTFEPFLSTLRLRMSLKEHLNVFFLWIEIWSKIMIHFFELTITSFQESLRIETIHSPVWTLWNHIRWDHEKKPIFQSDVFWVFLETKILDF